MLMVYFVRINSSYGLMAWQHSLEQYDEFARDSYPSYYVEQTKTRNCQLREMLKAVLDELLRGGHPRL